MAPLEKQMILADLGDGLILRRSTRGDAPRVARFNLQIHRMDDTHEPDPGVAAWTRDLFRPNHPTFGPGDFTLVEDTRTRQIVSAVCLIDQTWTYEDIAFGVGRPELVGTLPEYRRRGLIREQFKVIHRWSAERGQQVQGITGIPWYYRQFGYEMGLGLGGGRVGYMPGNIPTLKSGEREVYRIRPAAENDLAFITQVYAAGARRWLVNDVRDERIWHYELSGRARQNGNALEVRIVERTDGEPVGFLAYFRQNVFDRITIGFYELVPGRSYAEVTPAVLRYIQKTGEQYARRQKRRWTAFYMALGPEHPVHQAMGHLMPTVRGQYAWYVRVADVPTFLRTIAPVLERRLERTDFARYSGSLSLSFYRTGVRLNLENGCVKSVEAWQPDQTGDGSAAFPDQTFLQLLFGYHSYAELKAAFADVWTEKDEIGNLLSALFPKQPSRTWGLA